MELPPSSINPDNFKTKVNQYFGQSFNGTRVRDNLTHLSEVARDSFILLAECAKVNKSTLEKIDILETAEEGLQIALNKIKETRGWLESKSAEETKATKDLVEVRNELAVQRKKESQLWNGEGIIRGAVAKFVPNYLEKAAASESNAWLEDSRILFRIGAFRLMGKHQVMGKDIDNMAGGIGLVSIVEDLHHLKKTWGHLLEAAGEKLDDLIGSLEAAKELVHRYDAVKKINNLNQVIISFDSPENAASNYRLRLLDITYGLRKRAKQLKPGQEILIPCSAKSSAGSHTFQIAIGKDAGGSYHFRFIDTDGNHIKTEDLGLRDYWNIAKILVTSKMDDLGFKNLTLEQATDPHIWEILISHNLGNARTNELKELFQTVVKYFIENLKCEPATIRKHQIQHAATCEDTSVMAWIETVVSPVLYQMIELHRIIVGFKKLEEYQAKYGVQQLTVTYGEKQYVGQEVIDLLKGFGKRRFEEIYAKLEGILNNQFDSGAANRDMKRLGDETKRLNEEFKFWSAINDPGTEAKLRQDAAEVRLEFCVESKQSSKKPDAELIIPKRWPLLPNSAQPEDVVLWEIYQKKLRDLNNLLESKKQAPAKIAAIEEDIESVANKTRDLSKAPTRHKEYQALLEHFYNNFPYRDEKKVKVEFEDFTNFEDVVASNLAKTVVPEKK